MIGHTQTIVTVGRWVVQEKGKRRKETRRRIGETRSNGTYDALRVACVESGIEALFGQGVEALLPAWWPQKWQQANTTATKRGWRRTRAREKGSLQIKGKGLARHWIEEEINYDEDELVRGCAFYLFIWFDLRKGGSKSNMMIYTFVCMVLNEWPHLHHPIHPLGGKVSSSCRHLLLQYMFCPFFILIKIVLNQSFIQLSLSSFVSTIQGGCTKLERGKDDDTWIIGREIFFLSVFEHNKFEKKQRTITYFFFSLYTGVWNENVN